MNFTLMILLTGRSIREDFTWKPVYKRYPPAGRDKFWTVIFHWLVFTIQIDNEP